MTTETSEASVTVRRAVDAPRARVFRAFVDPDALATWLAPEETMTTTVHTFEPEVGGQFSLTMANDENRWEHAGRFEEIVEPERLVFSWDVPDESTDADDPTVGESQVTVEFERIDGGTEVVLTHDRLPNPESVDAYAQGWPRSLDHLRTVTEESI